VKPLARTSSEYRHGLLTTELRDRADELEAAKSVLPVMPNVVEEDERTVGPAREYCTIQVEPPDDCIDIVRPQLRLTVAVARHVGKAMTSHIQRH
jgi:hypothetical protein